jgi:CDGSH-type Zn-finger protein/uncharacterized Fe-S cluster protein YjdI
MQEAEPVIVIDSRDQLLYTLTEAAEVEHNLMCCYLYAAWSLKTEDDDGLAPELQQELKRWQRVVLDVAIDEMTHLALVCNLMNALSGVAHLNRPNFPIAKGYHPSEMQVWLAPFDRDTLQHFVHLERPEGSDEPDGQAFAHKGEYKRGLNGLRLTPSAQDYQTVGHLYRSVDAGLRRLSARQGEAALFCGDPALQVGPEIVSLKGLIAVTNLQTALQAIETIVEQGEGAQTETAEGHFQRFISVRDSYDRYLARDPHFKPAHPAAVNPVMRRPPVAEGRVWVSNAEPQSVLDLANALYNHMLQFLAHGFGATEAAEKRAMLNTAIDLMFAVDPLAKELARLKANDDDNCHAGISFAVPHAIAAPAPHANSLSVLTQRMKDLLEGGRALKPTPRVQKALAAMSAVYTRLSGTISSSSPAAPAKSENKSEQSASPLSSANPDSSGAPEVAQGRDITLIFDTTRCIHARHCVTGAPKTFLANVEGPWLLPDETAEETLVEVAHACPSGAVTYRRSGGKADEAAPAVNLLRLRENGPYALRAPLQISGEPQGYRATLCRCGGSKNKPYCDNTHNEIRFSASGELATISLDPLANRDGPLQIEPMRNGPLQVAGNLEICTGTGRVIRRITETKLCRCGHSNSKPFCDGSHRRAGFEAAGR